jgi:hypothetical protein
MGGRKDDSSWWIMLAWKPRLSGEAHWVEQALVASAGLEILASAPHPYVAMLVACDQLSAKIRAPDMPDPCGTATFLEGIVKLNQPHFDTKGFGVEAGEPPPWS